MKMNFRFKLLIFVFVQGLLCLEVIGKTLSDEEACQEKEERAPILKSLDWIGMTVTVDEETKIKIENESNKYAGIFEWRTKPKRYSKSIAFHPNSYENLEIKLLCYKKIKFETLSVLRIVNDGKIIYARGLQDTKYAAQKSKYEQQKLMDSINEELRSFQGKTLWTKGRLFYDYDRETRKSKKTANLAPVKMGKMVVNQEGSIEVFQGAALKPISLVLETEHSGTIFYDLISGYLRRGKLTIPALNILKKNFHLTNPRISHPKWDSETWNIIVAQRVKLGMTKDMAILSWGEPLDTNTTINTNSRHEQLVYPNGRYIYFVNGILTTVQH